MIGAGRKAVRYGGGTISGIPVAVATRPGQCLVDYATKLRNEIQDRLAVTGAYLFRGFAPLDGDRLDVVATMLTGPTIDYVERSTPRRRLTSRTYTATEYPADQEIFLHNENSYASRWPAYLYFYCSTPAGQGGGTLLAALDLVEATLDSTVRRTLERRGLLLRRSFRNGLGVAWDEAFGVSDMAGLSAFAAREGYRLSEGRDGCPVLEYPHPPVARDPRTGDARWFNHAAFFQPDGLDAVTQQAICKLYSEEGLPNRIFYGDGSVLESGTIDILRSTYRGAACTHNWQKDDLLVIDNMRFAHGRNPFVGRRDVWVAMSGECRRDEEAP